MTTLVEQASFEWWVNSKCCGTLPTGKEWPKGDLPILYAHFRVKTAKTVSRERFAKAPPKLRPFQLLYIGERKRESNFVGGPKNYSWLLAGHAFSWMYTVYWRLLDPWFQVDEQRKTLESAVFFDVATRYQGDLGALRQNGGMQFKKQYLRERPLLICKYEILKQLAELGI